MAPLVRDLSTCSRPVLIRLCLWEESRYSQDLQAHLTEAGHPFVVRTPILDPIEAIFGTSGVYVELFVLPIDLGRLLKILQLSSVEHVLESQFVLRGLPILFLRRRRQPADELTPYLEFKLVLNLLPRWSPRLSQATLSVPPLEHVALGAPGLLKDSGVLGSDR